MAVRAKASDPCMNLASCTLPSRPIRTCRITVPCWPFALAGYPTAGCSVSSARSAASGITTGSIEFMAASGALLPLASGVSEVICDFRLEGIPELVGIDAPAEPDTVEGTTVCAFLGGIGCCNEAGAEVTGAATVGELAAEFGVVAGVVAGEPAVPVAPVVPAPLVEVPAGAPVGAA